MHYEAPDGIPNLRLLGDTRTEIARRFYERAPFPDYPPLATLSWLRARAERSEFARLLDETIPGDARVVEIGCGTGQMSLYLAHADRIVIGADLTRESLRLGVEAAQRFELDQVQFIETDLHHPGLRAGAFDVKVAVRGRFKFDAKGRFGINAGLYTGANFIAGFKNTGLGFPIRGGTTQSPTFASIHVSCTPGSPA